MKYQILVEKPAEKFISRLPKPEKERVLRAISKLPNTGDIKRLQGRTNKDLFRLRVGEYRIIYRVDNGKLIVCVIDAGNRGEIYNRY
ncbi:MAG: type II toxin-antitoxin system RelE/ParE family toxin [Oscillospiraceae bacterium]|nr:type II toxin-antitoxin system RelE/ParE family toxin [Oscillospiraceae bacterium]